MQWMQCGNEYLNVQSKWNVQEHLQEHEELEKWDPSSRRQRPGGDFQWHQRYDESGSMDWIFAYISFTGVNGGGVITNGVTSNGVGGDSDEEMEVN